MLTSDMFWHQKKKVTDLNEDNTPLICTFIKSMSYQYVEVLPGILVYSMRRHQNGNIFRVSGPCAGNSPVTCEFPAQRPVTGSFDVLFHLCLNKRLSKQPWGWWFRRHRDHYDVTVMLTWYNIPSEIHSKTNVSLIFYGLNYSIEHLLY